MKDERKQSHGSRRVTRRRALAGLTTAAIASTAGCTDLFGGGSDNGDDDGDTPDPNGDDGNGDDGNGDDGNGDDGNGEEETPDYPYPFDYPVEDLYLQPEDPWEHLTDSDPFTGSESTNHPSSLETGGYTQYENPRDSSDSPTLTHTVLVFESPDAAEEYYTDTIDDLNDHEHGFVEETELTDGFYQQVDDAFAYVLDDEYDRDRFVEGYDERHSGTAITRIANLVATVEHHRIAPGDPEEDDYEYHGNTDQPISYGEDVISYWASNHDEISNYLMNS